MPFVHQQRKSEQQSRMKQPKILKLLQKKQKRGYNQRRRKWKLRGMALCY